MALFTLADAIEFPRNPPELTNDWNLIVASASPGSTVSSSMPYAVTAGGGLWSASLNELAHVRADHVRYFRAVRAGALAGARPLIVYRNDGLVLAPYPLDLAGNPIPSYGDIPFSDGAFFSDGTGFYQPAISAILVADAAMNDTAVTISFLTGGPLRGGESFSLYHPVQGWRLYEIATVIIDGSGHSVVTFTPWLRDDIAANSTVEFDRPRCTMKLADGKAMNFNFATYPFTRPSVPFIEYFFPPS